MRKLALSCLLAAGMTCTAGAHAGGVNYTASITDVSIGVIDLTPGDAWSPSYSYQLSGSTYSLELGEPDGTVQKINSTTPTTGPLQHLLSAGSSNAGLSIDPLGNLSAQGKVHSDLAPGYARSSASQEYVFRLSPFSVLTMSAHVELDLSTFGLVHPDQTAGAGAYIRMYNTKARTDTLATINVGSPGELRSEDFWLSIANPTSVAEDITVIFNVGAGTFINAEPLPVPEPSTYAMLVVGLLAVGARSRRNRRA